MQDATLETIKRAIEANTVQQARQAAALEKIADRIEQASLRVSDRIEAALDRQLVAVSHAGGELYLLLHRMRSDQAAAQNEIRSDLAGIINELLDDEDETEVWNEIDELPYDDDETEG